MSARQILIVQDHAYSGETLIEVQVCVEKCEGLSSGPREPKSRLELILRYEGLIRVYSASGRLTGKQKNRQRTRPKVKRSASDILP